MKKWIIIAAAVYFAATTGTIAVLSVQLKNKTEMCSHLKEQTEEQSRVIDSLLNRRMTVFDVQMHVQDKSRFSIYGKYNKGTINVPNERKYILEVDSVNIKIK